MISQSAVLSPSVGCVRGLESDDRMVGGLAVSAVRSHNLPTVCSFCKQIVKSVGAGGQWVGCVWSSVHKLCMW